MNATIKLIWQTATNLGFNFSESDAHEMYLELKNNTIAEIQKQQLTPEEVIELQIFDTVHNWCDMQSLKIPDQLRWYLMDGILEIAKQYSENFEDYWKNEYNEALEEIGNLQNQLKDAECAVRDLESELQNCR